MRSRAFAVSRAVTHNISDATIWARYEDRRSSSVSAGRSVPVPFAASVDWTATYGTALLASGVLSLACGVASFFVRRPAI
jgi:hypothetical protein